MFPGENYIAQIKLIIDVLGSQKEEDLNFITNSSAKSFVMQFKNIKPKDFKEILKYDNNEALDLIKHMLVFNPEKRYSIEDSLNHPYLKSIREGIEDPVFDGKINFDFDYDKNVTVSQLLLLLLKEVETYPSGFVIG